MENLFNPPFNFITLLQFFLFFYTPMAKSSSNWAFAFLTFFLHILITLYSLTKLPIPSSIGSKWQVPFYYSSASALLVIKYLIFVFSIIFQSLLAFSVGNYFTAFSELLCITAYAGDILEIPYFMQVQIFLLFW